jgi:hypothetical protein
VVFCVVVDGKARIECSCFRFLGRIEELLLRLVLKRYGWDKKPLWISGHFRRPVRQWLIFGKCSTGRRPDTGFMCARRKPRISSQKPAFFTPDGYKVERSQKPWGYWLAARDSQDQVLAGILRLEFTTSWLLS